MKKVTGILFCSIFYIVLLSQTTSAQIPTQDKWFPHGSFSLSFQDKYVGLTVSRVVYDNPILSSNIYLQLPKGWFINLWTSNGLDDNDFSSNSGDELDFTTGWNTRIHDLDVNISTTLLNFHPTGNWRNGNGLVESLQISKNFLFGDHFIRPEFWIEWISKIKRFKHGSVVLLPNIQHKRKNFLDLKTLTLFNKIMIVWDDGFEGTKNNSDGVFVRWNTGLHWQLSKMIMLTLPKFTILTPITNPSDGRKQEATWSSGIKILF